MYGDKIDKTNPYASRSVIGDVETSVRGNIILRVGQLNVVGGNGWHQTEHVVLSPDEARAFVADIQDRIEDERGPRFNLGERVRLRGNPEGPLTTYIVVARRGLDKVDLIAPTQDDDAIREDGLTSRSLVGSAGEPTDAVVDLAGEVLHERGLDDAGNKVVEH